MKRTLKLPLLFLILIITLLASVSCEIIDLFRNERHSCQFLDSRVVSEHNCTTDGIVIRSCICGRETTDITPATGHSFGEWETTRDADCTTIGNRARICAECGESENHEIPKANHNYEISGEQVGEVMFNRYVCLDCDESFSIDSGIAIPPEEEGTKLLTDLPCDYSFVIISVGNEEYIKKNLRLYELSSYRNSECDYALTNLGEGKWRVSPSSEYAPGKSYIAERDGGIFFLEFGTRSIILTMLSDERSEVTLNKEVIYIAALEEENPGYYPFSVEFSDGSGSVFLSLERSDGLATGDLICVGSAKSDHDVLSGTGANLFGRIKSITKLTDGRSLIMLDAESMEDLFPTLDVYKDEPTEQESLKPTVGHEAKLVATLLADDDFLTMTEAFYKAADELISLRGMTTDHKSAEEMISAITTEGSRESQLIPDENGRLTLYAIAETTVKLSIPVKLGNRVVGEISSTVSFVTELTEGRIKLQLNRDGDLFLDVSEKLKSSVKFHAYTDIDYTADDELFLYENENKLYHMAGCEEIASRAAKVTIPELLETEDPAQCEHCKPLSFLASLLVNDGELVHSLFCGELTIDDETVFTEADASLILGEELLSCPNCMKNTEVTGELSERLVKAISEMELEEGNDEPKFMTLGVFATSVSGLDRQVFSLSMNLDFPLLTKAEYEITSESSGSFSYRIFDGRVVRYTEGNADGGPICELEVFLLGFKVKYE